MDLGSLSSSMCDNSLNHSYNGLGGNYQYDFFCMSNLDGLYDYYGYAAEIGLENPYGLYDSYNAMGVGTDYDAIYNACCGLMWWLSQLVLLQSMEWFSIRFFRYAWLGGPYNSYGYAAQRVLNNPYGLYNSYNGIGVENHYDYLHNPCCFLGGNNLCTPYGSNYHVLEDDRPCNSKVVIIVLVEGLPN